MDWTGHRGRHLHRGRERFSKSWQPASGYLLASPDGGLELITTREHPAAVELHYGLGTAPAQQVLTLTIVISLLLSLINALWPKLSMFRRQRPVQNLR